MLKIKREDVITSFEYELSIKRNQRRVIRVLR